VSTPEKKEEGEPRCLASGKKVFTRLGPNGKGKGKKGRSQWGRRKSSSSWEKEGVRLAAHLEKKGSLLQDGAIGSLEGFVRKREGEKEEQAHEERGLRREYL